MVAIAAQIDSGWLDSSMTFVATRAGIQLGTGAAVVSSLASGLVKAVATINMSSYGAGNVDLSLIENTTKSLIWLGAIEIDASGDLVIANLSAIQAKTDLIGTGTAIITAPVVGANTIPQIIRDDDYKAANGRAFIFTVANPGNIANPATALCRFGGKKHKSDSNVWTVDGVVADAGGGDLTLTFDLPRLATADLELGSYEWSAELIDDSGNEITVARSGDCRTKLIEKYT